MLTAADMLMGESAASEAAEPKVEASPKMGRDRFNYLEPRPRYLQSLVGMADRAAVRGCDR